MKLSGLTEKRILKQLARDIVPPEIIARPKQPYRAPDAISLLGEDSAPYVRDLLSQSAIARAGLFEHASVERLHAKCAKRVANDPETVFSNTDNMAMVGIVSCQLLHQHLIAGRPESNVDDLHLNTDIDGFMTDAVSNSEEGNVTEEAISTDVLVFIRSNFLFDGAATLLTGPIAARFRDPGFDGGPRADLLPGIDI